MTHRTRLLGIAGLAIAATIAATVTFVTLRPWRPVNVQRSRLNHFRASFVWPSRRRPSTCRFWSRYDQKLFESHGLASDLVFFNNTNDVINAFLRGDAEVAAIGSGGVFALEAASPGRVRLIYGQENKSYSLIVPAGSQVAKIEDLRGKRIVTWPSPTPKAFLKLILDPRIGKQGYSLTQVDQRFLLQALARGDVDALFIQDIYAWQAVNSGKGRFLSVLPLEEYVAKPFFNGGGVIQSKTASIDPGLARSIREVLDDSVRFIREHEPEARSSLERHLGVSPDVAQHAAIDRFVTVDEIDWPGGRRSPISCASKECSTRV